MDYEFTIVFRVNQQHLAESTKDRTGIFSDFHEVLKEEHAVKISNWLNDGVTTDEYTKQQQEQFVQSWFGQSFNQRQLCNGRLQYA